MLRKIILLLALSLAVLPLEAQDRTQLEQQRRAALSEIEQTNKILEENLKSQKQSMNRLNTLSAQISARKKYLNVLNSEIDRINEQILDNQRQSKEINTKIENIKDSMAENLRSLYKNGVKDNFLAYLFTSKDFTQAYRRKIYFDQLNSYRKSQVDTANLLLDKLKVLNAELEVQRAGKDSVLKLQKAEMAKIEAQAKTYDNTIKKLKNNASKLRKDIQAQQKIANRLSAEIKKLIEQETKKLGAKSGDIYTKLSQVDKTLSKNFADNKGKLPWPVDAGFISQSYGQHTHPVLKVTLPFNNGLDISTSAGTQAKAVFDGEVSRVVLIPGANYTIILRHGNYLTVYQNLVKINVKQGDRVSIGHPLGTIFTDKTDNSTILHFELWKESEKNNPANWLRKQ